MTVKYTNQAGEKMAVQVQELICITDDMFMSDAGFMLTSGITEISA